MLIYNPTCELNTRGGLDAERFRAVLQHSLFEAGQNYKMYGFFRLCSLSLKGLSDCWKDSTLRGSTSYAKGNK